MSRVRRYDAGTLQPPRRLPNGMLLAEGRISRTGIQVYADAQGRTHRELRLPEEVFAPASMASLRMVPLTNDHPPELLTAANARQYQVGHVGEAVRQDGDYLAAPIMVTDAGAVEAVTGGRNQLSVGYTCEMDPTQDTNLIQRWGPYDFIQRNIEGNHLALVDAARAGPGATLRLDADDARMVASSASPPTTEHTHMPQTLRIGGLSIEVTDGNAPAIQQAITQELAAVKERSDAAVKEATERAAKADKAKATVLDNARRILARLKTRADAVKARMAMCDECDGTGKVMGPDGVEKTCEYCDGAGSYRMHDMVAATAMPAEGEADEGMDDPDGDEDMDAGALEQEAPPPAKGDAARSRADAAAAKRRKAERTQLRADRKASLQRKVDRAVKQRVDLEVAARRYLPADTDLVKLDELGIRKAVIQALCPEAKLDGKPPEQVRARYDAEVERAGAAPNAADQARLGASPFVAPGHRTDGRAPTAANGAQPRGRAAMLAQHGDAAKRAAGQLHSTK